ncbi:MAG: hypothetical protein ACO1SV_25260 [Fimbriimonas sp.]
MKTLLTLALLAATSAAMASETFLISIPVADILGDREAYAMAYAYGNERNVSRGAYAFGQGLELGLGDRIEFGYDNDFLGSTLLNAKLQIASGETWALSAGFNGAVPGGRTSNQYLVGRLDFSDFRLHAGILKNDRNRLMLGIDGDLGGGWSYMADFVSGPGSATWVGVNAPLGNLCLTVAGGLPGRRSDGIQHMVSLMAYFRI